MKKFLFAIIMICSMACNQPQEKSKTITDTPLKDSTTIQTQMPLPKEEVGNDPILFIRKKVEHINTTSLTKKHVEFMCDELTKVDFYTDNGEIVKISIDFGTIGDVYAKEDYYYSNNKLIFFYEFVEGGPACEGCIKTNEYRSYVKNDQVFKYLKNKNQEQCRKCSFGPSSRQYLLLKAKTPAEIKKAICKL